MAHRIVLVESAFGFGGSVVALARLLRALPREEFEPLVLARLPSQAEHVRAAAGPGVAVKVVPLARARRPGGTGIVSRTLGALDHVRRHRPYALAVAREARAFGASLVHVNNAVASNWGAIVGARRAGLPVVVKQHGYDWRSWDVRRLAQEVSCFLPDSEHVAADLESLGVPRSRMVVTWCPVDVAEFDRPAERTAVRSELSLPAEAPVAAMVGMLARWKGQLVFLEAVAEAARRVPDLRAVVVGALADDEDRAYEAELRARAASLGIADRVVFAGLRSDVPRLLPAFDVCVHASVRAEPFGMVIAEAMAARRPVVASAAGGPCEQVEEGASGFLVPPGDAAALADRMARILLDPALGRSMGERGRTIVEERFTSERHAALTAAAYRRILER